MALRRQQPDGSLLIYYINSGYAGWFHVLLMTYNCWVWFQIFTSCYGGSIQLMDAEKEVFDKIYSSESAIFSLSQRPNYVNCLYFGEGNGGLNLWDMRAGKEPSSSWPLHEYRINTIDFNINNPNIMATSSSDATACIWDLRKIDSDKPKTLKTVSHARAVHSAYFSPSGSSLATTRYVELFELHYIFFSAHNDLIFNKSSFFKVCEEGLMVDTYEINSC